MHFAQDWAIQGKDQQQQESVKAKGIPEEYRCHHKVFLDQQATCFPPSRPEDHVIKLIPGALETINCKVYPLTLAEQEVTKKFLEENERLGYIKKTDSPWSLPWFFIKKERWNAMTGARLLRSEQVNSVGRLPHTPHRTNT
jgi:hypothetical protein